MSDLSKTPDNHRDRLVDRVLAEALGGERPPDLSSTILDRLEEQKVNIATDTSSQRIVPGRSRHWTRHLGSIALAASVCLIVTAVLLPAKQSARNGDRFVALNQESESQWSSAADSSVKSAPEREVMRYEVAVDDLMDTNRVREAERRLGASSVFNRTPDTQVSPETRLLLEKSQSVPAAPASQQPRPSVAAQSSVSEEDLKYFEPVELSDLAATPRPTFGWYGSTEKLYEQTESRRWPIADSAVPAIESWREQTPHRERYKAVDIDSFYGKAPTGDRYATIHENPFTKPLGEDALSTFSIDVDTASYSNLRQYLLDMRQMPPAGAVRVEELVNYFDYDYAPPAAGSEAPFAAAMAVAPCPWAPSHRLVRIGVKGREVAVDKRPLSNLVFLVDVSGSMNEPNKLPLVVEGLKALTDKLGENDRVAIAVYAGSEGLVLPSTTGDQKDAIRSVLSRLTAGGSTAGGAGLRLAYEVAERHKITGGVNRVVLCTDGDFNVGMTGTEELAKFVETRAKETGVYLTVLGFGRGNLNDAMLEQISGRGDGHYAYIDNEREARRVLSQDLSGTLVTIAKDVKLQVEFNPAQVASYRLIGYENRVLAAEDFNNDAKDAGDIGAGHTVTALYEIVPVGVEPQAPPVDGLKYQSAAVEDDAARVGLSQPTTASPELLTLKIRYKQPEGGASTKLEFPLVDTDKTLAEADADFRWAAAIAEFGMLLRGSKHVGDATFDTVLERARGAIGEDVGGYRAEFLDIVRRAQEINGH